MNPGLSFDTLHFGHFILSFGYLHGLDSACVGKSELVVCYILYVFCYIYIVSASTRPGIYYSKICNISNNNVMMSPTLDNETIKTFFDL